ncbi:hypothetical protein EOD41_05635 [Mucilaginibacter limnophilus]|uniref:Uncharacterized protein n=1 Tax=Mucilaginibacter limnophilus TaxID=1932778 RepID=A0A437MUV1_9SPHI|nr:hypothetical protein [Mucilaginibacter limnophilus]RVU01444.1 hypothetical protein EOD41_05635 [Mucilaginibacter limnophilus]
MKTRFLFPYHWRKIGVALFILGFIVSGLTLYFRDAIAIWYFEHNPKGKPLFDELTHDISLLLWICGLFLTAFTKEKIEDEQIAQLRLDSLQWSIYFNYAVLVICIILIDSWHLMLGVAAHYIFTPLIFFIIRFRWAIYQANRSLKND